MRGKKEFKTGTHGGELLLNNKPTKVLMDKLGGKSVAGYIVKLEDENKQLEKEKVELEDKLAKCEKVVEAAKELLNCGIYESLDWAKLGKALEKLNRGG